MSYHHFTPVGRGKIEIMHRQGMSQQAIADELGCHRTSVLRELRRNSTRNGYDAQTAQQGYEQRREACRRVPKLAADSRLRDYAAEKIANEDWTPEIVSGRLALEFPDSPDMRVCHETIYQAIYTDGHYLDFLREELPQARHSVMKANTCAMTNSSTWSEAVKLSLLILRGILALRAPATMAAWRLHFTRMAGSPMKILYCLTCSERAT